MNKQHLLIMLEHKRSELEMLPANKDTDIMIGVITDIINDIRERRI